MKTGRPLTFSEQDIALIRRMAKKGIRVVEIAKKLNRPASGIYCLMDRLQIPKQPRNQFPKKSNNPSWKGGRWIDKDGYVMILCKDHPNATHGGYVREHRLVMELRLKRHLTRDEVVHHVDRNKQNNKIENLRLYQSNAEHLKDELTGKVPNWTEDGRRRILKAVRQRRPRKAKSTQT